MFKTSIQLFQYGIIRKGHLRLFSTRNFQYAGHTSKYLLTGAAIGVFGISAIFCKQIIESKEHEDSSEMSNPVTGNFSAKDIQKHKSLDTGIWTTYKNDVFDVTSFVNDHPGGSIILAAAGGPLEPFWEEYNLHNTEQVLDLLYSMKIGTMSEEERDILFYEGQKVIEKQFQNEPKRSPEFINWGSLPFCGEVPLDKITKHFNTPNEIFYVRNHFPVPSIKENEYLLSLAAGGGENKMVTFTLKDLKSLFRKVNVNATLQCCGNKRTNMFESSDPFAPGPCGVSFLSNAEWGGVLLRDIFSYAGISVENLQGKHIIFIGEDHDITGVHYEISIPADIVLNKHSKVLLAYEMNGKTLPRDHGYPIRVVVPGVVGARSVKWLKEIKISDTESSSFWQTNDYRTLPPSANKGRDIKSLEPIYEMPVSSAICIPSEGSVLDSEKGEVDIEGYAYSGGGRAILYVHVSVDGGKTWHLAKMQRKGTDYHSWSWVLWKITLPITQLNKDTGNMNIVCVATDSSYNVQPKDVKNIVNPRGFLNNSWHNVNVNITHAAKS